MIIAGVFGAKLSGKTTLCKALSRQYWAQEKRPSLVYDPWLDNDWGAQAWVTNNESQFINAVWKKKNCVMVVDEAAMTIRREREKIPLFTASRHQGHKLIIIGHSGVDLLPTMREQIDAIFLFRQTKKAATLWVETFADERILEATQLGRYEFLRCELHGEVKKMSLNLQS